MGFCQGCWLAAFFQFQPPDFLVEYFIAGAGASESLKRAVERATRSVSAEVLAARARAVIECDATPQMRQLKVPVLYLQASEDRLVGKECLDQIKSLHPQTTSVSIRTSHLLLQREPRIASEAILQFLDA